MQTEDAEIRKARETILPLFIRKRGGFSWVFKTQIYPPGFEQLTKTLYRRLDLPVTVRTDLPEKTIEIFHRWVESNINI